MHITRSITRRRLDRLFDGLADQIGPLPPPGWIKTIRQALGMSTVDLSSRLEITQSRVCQLERAERDGSIRLSTLSRVGTALGCQLLYVFLPCEPLEQMVRQQARKKAAEEMQFRAIDAVLGGHELPESLLTEFLEARARELVDSYGLWRPTTRPSKGGAQAPP